MPCAAMFVYKWIKIFIEFWWYMMNKLLDKRQNQINNKACIVRYEHGKYMCMCECVCVDDSSVVWLAGGWSISLDSIHTFKYGQYLFPDRCALSWHTYWSVSCYSVSCTQLILPFDKTQYGNLHMLVSPASAPMSWFFEILQIPWSLDLRIHSNHHWLW